MKAKLNIRWMLKKDLPTVLDIEARAFDWPWPEDQFIHCIRQKNVIGMVATLGDDLVGYMIYDLLPKRLELLNFAVDYALRRQGVGRAMFDTLIGKLSMCRRTHIVVQVMETNLDALAFFRAMGFEADGLLRGYYAKTEVDAISMVYRKRAKVSA